MLGRRRAIHDTAEGIVNTWGAIGGVSFVATTRYGERDTFRARARKLQEEVTDALNETLNGRHGEIVTNNAAITGI